MTSTCLITEVKQQWTTLVLEWLTIGVLISLGKGCTCHLEFVLWPDIHEFQCTTRVFEGFVVHACRLKDLLALFPLY